MSGIPSSSYQRVGGFRSVHEFQDYLTSLGIELPVDEKILSAAEGSPMAEPLKIGDFTVGNRWCIHPMEGWDANPDGSPTANLLRRWEHFGLSGAKLIWGGEAFAVCEAGRANPHQLYMNPAHVQKTLETLVLTLTGAHKKISSDTSDFFIGLQLTHSGRFSNPGNSALKTPKIAYHHSLLDARVHLDPEDNSVIITDGELRELTDLYVQAAKYAWNAGFHFIDVKHCHGYLGHELLSAYDRPGMYGGSLENRTRFMREICEGVRSECPGLKIGVRLSLFDTLPYKPDPATTTPGKLGRGIPTSPYPTPYPGFGCNRANPLEQDLTEPLELVRMMTEDIKIDVLNFTAGSPYYNPHIQRPTFIPPSDAYQPPEDPLISCVRQIQAVRKMKDAFPKMPMIGTAYTYFQDFMPQVAQAVVGRGWVDSVGIGRMVLSYWDYISDTLAGRPIQTRRICRTFSDCTTGPRNGLISGCYPLDHYYKEHPDAQKLIQIKKR